MREIEKEQQNTNPNAPNAYRNLEVGIVFQNYNLMYDLTVYQNIELALKIQEWEGKSKENIQQMIMTVLSFVDLTGYENKKISELSGGEQQRIAMLA